MLISIVVATIVVSLVSLIGIIYTDKLIKKRMHYFISFAAGTLIAIAFFDLIPEALTELDDHALLGVVALGIVFFFLIERFIHWHHCGKAVCDDKPAGLLILTGDFVHNFFDGVIIAGAFLFSFNTGVLTTFSIMMHEIPQELGDFAVLIHSGFSKAKALWLNFLSALSAVIGGVVGYFAFETMSGISPFILLLAAGGFIYVALTDIVPSMHKHGTKTLFAESLVFVMTIAAFFVVLLGH